MAVPGFVGSGGFVMALAARRKIAPRYFSYCLGRSILTFSVALKNLKTQPHNTVKKLRVKKYPCSKAKLENFISSIIHAYAIFRTDLSFRGICGWQCSKLGAWELWGSVAVLPVQRDLPQGYTGTALKRVQPHVHTHRAGCF